MAIILARDSEIHISATEGGTYTLFGQILTVSLRSEATDDERIYTLGSDVPVVEAGQDESTMDITFFYDPADTLGQNVARTARAAGTTVFIRRLWDGENGEQQEMQVLNHNMDVDPNGTGVNKYVRGSATLRSAGPVSAIVAP